MNELGVGAVAASRLWRAAVNETRGACFGQELVQRRRFVQGPLTQLWLSLVASPDAWGDAWQRGSLALCHTGGRRAVVCTNEVFSGARLPQLALAERPHELRVLVDVHLFSWFLVPSSARRSPAPAAAAKGGERTIDEPAQLLGLEGLAFKAPMRGLNPPWRVPRLAEEGRVLPDRATIERTSESGSVAEAGTLIPVAIRNMVPTGGNHLLPGWGSTAVVIQQPLRLEALGEATGGAVWAGAQRHVVVGTSNVRREVIWRHALDGDSERAPLGCPTEALAAQYAVRLPVRPGSADTASGWLPTALYWRRF